MAAGDWSRTRLAMISMPSGSPCTRRHSSAIAARSMSSASNEPSTSAAARQNRRTAGLWVSSSRDVAGAGTGNGSSPTTYSPSICSGRRLVASTRTAGASSSSRATGCGVPTSGSQRSSRSSRGSPDRAPARRAASAPPPAGIPNASAVTAISSLNPRAPSMCTVVAGQLRAATRRRMSSRAVQVFPTPGGPVKVTRRAASSANTSPALLSSSSRPDRSAGSPCETRAWALVPAPIVRC